MKMLVSLFFIVQTMHCNAKIAMIKIEIPFFMQFFGQILWHEKCGEYDFLPECFSEAF